MREVAEVVVAVEEMRQQRQEPMAHVKWAAADIAVVVVVVVDSSFVAEVEKAADIAVGEVEVVVADTVVVG